MTWKNLPYWLKGGIIGLVFLGFFGIPTILCMLKCYEATCMVCFIPFFPIGIISLPLVLIISLISERFINSDLLITTIGILSEILYFFALGSIIGWIYGRIKKNK